MQHGGLQAANTRRRDLFLCYLESASLEFTRPEGAYFVLVDIADFDFKSDAAPCAFHSNDIGVAAAPGFCFLREPLNHLIRFHFAESESTLSAAGERLLRLNH